VRTCTVRGRAAAVAISAPRGVAPGKAHSRGDECRAPVQSRAPRRRVLPRTERLLHRRKRPESRRRSGRRRPSCLRRRPCQGRRLPTSNEEVVGLWRRARAHLEDLEGRPQGLAPSSPRRRLRRGLPALRGPVVLRPRESGVVRRRPRARHRIRAQSVDACVRWPDSTATTRRLPALQKTASTHRPGYLKTQRSHHGSAKAEPDFVGLWVVGRNQVNPSLSTCRGGSGQTAPPHARSS
jgi:hypothetical protein